MTEDPFVAHRSLQVSRSEQQAMVERFLAAQRTGRLQELMEVMAPDVAAVSLVVEDERATRVYLVRNPRKLTRLDEPADLAR
jgi:hypothetical protein